MKQTFAESALAVCREQLVILASAIDQTIVSEQQAAGAGRILGEQFRRAAKGSKEAFNELYAAVRIDAQLQDEAMARIHGDAAFTFQSRGAGKGVQKKGRVLNAVSKMASVIRKEFFPSAKTGADTTPEDKDDAPEAKESAPDQFEPAFLLVMAEAEAALPPTKHAAFLKLAAEVAKYHKQKVGK